LSNLFDKIIGRAKIKNFNKKLSRNVAAIFFENIEKSGMRTITRDMHESGNKRTCEFQPDIQKFLVAFSNEKFIRVCCSERVLFLGMSAYLKISVQPLLRFLRCPSVAKN
jgi:hypothetical protein